MSGNEPNDASRRLPVVLVHAAPRPSLARTAPPAAFISQLLAARDHLPVQRLKRRAPVAHAVAAYRSGGHVTERRLPAGYRRTVVA